MHTKIILISDDSDFFEYIIPKLSLRKSDELFRFGFAELPDKIYSLCESLLIINSENRQEQTLELLKIVNNVPSFVFGYNNSEEFIIEAYRTGMLNYFTPNTSDRELQSALISALKLTASINKCNIYREILVENNLITKNNEVFLDSNNLLDRELEKINKTYTNAVLAAISPDEKSKFTINSNQIETIILNNIRQDDILINYAANKYFLLLYNMELPKAKAIWEKISQQFSQPLYAGIVNVGNKTRQQLVNEALNKLHETINKGYKSSITANIYSGNNFKFFRDEFKKKLKNIISPVFYHIQQTYNDKLFEMRIEQGGGDDYSILYLKSRYYIGTFRITCPGYSTINIDIAIGYLNKSENIVEPKRICLEPEELEPGLLHDLIEQFISEFKHIEENCKI